MIQDIPIQEPRFKVGQYVVMKNYPHLGGLVITGIRYAAWYDCWEYQCEWLDGTKPEQDPWLFDVDSDLYLV